MSRVLVAQPACRHCGCPALHHPAYYPSRSEGDPICRCGACPGYEAREPLTLVAPVRRANWRSVLSMQGAAQE